jgi:hypothetical protein
MPVNDTVDLLLDLILILGTNNWCRILRRNKAAKILVVPLRHHGSDDFT